MFGRLAAAIARAIAAMGKDFWASLPAIGRTIDGVIEWPFRMLFGGAAPMPHYEPTITKPDVVEEFRHARRAAASVRRVDPSGIDTVRKFCAAPRHVRADMDVSAVPSNARAMLLTMGDDELDALSKAGPGKVKKFIDGKDHEIPGVPVVGVHAPFPANDRSPRQSLDHRRWKTEALLTSNVENRFKLG